MFSFISQVVILCIFGIMILIAFFCNICRITLELQKEAKVSKLNHRNIVALFATVCEPGHYGIVMEFVHHGALDDYILSNDVCCSVSFSYKRTYLCIFL